jgi:hypothetical protein
MVEWNAVADSKLATVTGINAKTATTTLIYDVPAGYSMIPIRTTIRTTAFTGATKTIQPWVSFGGNSTTYDDWLVSTTYTFSAASKAIIRTVTATEMPVYQAGTSFKIYVGGVGATVSNATTETWAVDLFGYLI